MAEESNCALCGAPVALIVSLDPDAQHLRCDGCGTDYFITAGVFSTVAEEDERTRKALIAEVRARNNKGERPLLHSGNWHRYRDAGLPRLPPLL